MHAFPTLSAIVPPDLRRYALGPLHDSPHARRLMDEHRERLRIAKRFAPFPPVMPGLDSELRKKALD